MTVESETLSPTTKEETTNIEQTLPNNEEVVKNYENLVKQQQEQIQQLLKQQELNNKVNKQLESTVKEMQEKNNKENKHWVDSVLERDFQFYAPPSYRGIGDQGSASIVAPWYMQYLKEQGFDSRTIANKMKRVFESAEEKHKPIIEDTHLGPEIFHTKTWSDDD